MPTHYHYAVFSQQVYKNYGGILPDKLKQEGWEIYKTDYNPQNFKFAAAAYINKNTRELVVSFRGTVISLENLVTDIFLFSNNYPTTFGYAKLFIKELIEKLIVENILINEISVDDDDDDKQYFKLSFTGHSLGSIFAEILACQLGLTAITFESPGSKHIIDDDAICLDRVSQGYSPKEKIICYLSAPNAINTFNSHIGHRYRMYVEHVEPGLSHSFICESILGSAGRIVAGVGAATAAVTVGPAAALITAAPMVLATGAEVLDKAAGNVDSSQVKDKIKLASHASKTVAATLSVVEAAKGLTNTLSSGFNIIKTVVSGSAQTSTARTLSSLSSVPESAGNIAQELKILEKITANAAQVKRSVPPTLFTGRPVKVASYMVMKNGDVYNLMMNSRAQQVILDGGKISRATGFLLFQNEQELRNLFQMAINHQPVANYNWLLRQHSIDNIVKLFDPHTGKINKRSIVEKWPKLSEAGLLSLIDKTAVGLVPFHPANPSIPNLIWSSQNDVIEEQIKRISDYQVTEQQAELLADIADEFVTNNVELSEGEEQDKSRVIRRRL